MTVTRPMAIATKDEGAREATAKAAGGAAGAALI
ncbi:MAG: hypothetical protein FD150_1624 [Rhodobacteraceae bacterium]|nr:MAG: hypothetical protein FD150_1624 [Paracoccaceae bacterium]